MIKIITPYDIKLRSNGDMYAMYNHCRALPVSSLFEYKLVLKYYFDPLFKTVIDHSADTRSREKQMCKIPKILNKYGKRQLAFHIPSLFNQIPLELKQIQKYKIIKPLIKYWVTSRI